MVYKVSGRGPRGPVIVIKKTLAEAEKEAAAMQAHGFKNVLIGEEDRL